jgi:hypothetical protein
VAAAAAALAAAALTQRRAQADVMRPGTWKAALYDSIVDQPKQVKSVFQWVNTHAPLPTQTKNWLNGMQFSYQLPADQLLVVVGAHGPAAIFTYNDIIWGRYQIGELFDVTDPATGRPALRNPIYRPTYTVGQSADPSDPDGYWQDTSLEVLQRRGVLFLT